MRNPSAAQVARSLGLRAEVDGERFDLVVLGAGPAGLAAAVYGGSEGLRTFVAEAWAPGGQAGTSTRIENYLGFPSGISGTELTRKATLQARRFDAVLSSFHRAVELADGPEGLVRVDLDDGQHVLARSVVMATGARWRELQAEGVDRFRGAGVYHAAMATDAERCRDEDVIVVGGGNSAGQAAVHLATRARSVRIVVRGKALKSTMSHYLVDRIERSPRIEVMTETEISAVHGTATVESVSLRDRRDGSVEQVPCDGGVRDDRRRPVHRGGERACSRVDAAGYLLCGAGAANCEGHLRWPLADREPHLLETVRPGVFAAGDVRAGASKRVAGAVGDGALVVRFAHDVLNCLGQQLPAGHADHLAGDEARVGRGQEDVGGRQLGGLRGTAGRVRLAERRDLLRRHRRRDQRRPHRAGRDRVDADALSISSFERPFVNVTIAPLVDA